jgi:hypothetical protein
MFMCISANPRYLSAYEELRSRDIGPLAAGGSARAVASAVTAPLDFARTNMQAGGGWRGCVAVAVAGWLAGRWMLAFCVFDWMLDGVCMFGKPRVY